MQNLTYQGVQMDPLLESTTEEWTRLWHQVKAGIEDGTVRPLPRGVYKYSNIDDAFQMADTDDKKKLIKVTTQCSTSLEKCCAKFPGFFFAVYATHVTTD